MGSPRGLLAAFSGVKRSAWWKSDAAILGSLAPEVDSNKQRKKKKKHMGYSTMGGWVDTVSSKPQCGSTQLNLSYTFSADAIEVDPSVQPRS